VIKHQTKTIEHLKEFIGSLFSTWMISWCSSREFE